MVFLFRYEGSHIKHPNVDVTQPNIKTEIENAIKFFCER